MKRLFVIPIMFIYLLAVSGIMISVHYCGHQMESWNIFADNKGCPEGSCSDKEKDSCCKDEVVSIKVSDDQNITSLLKIKLSSPAFTPAALLPVFMEQQVICHNTTTVTTYMSNAPPGRWQYIPLYKLHSNFTYYG